MDWEFLDLQSVCSVSSSLRKKTYWIMFGDSMSEAIKLTLFRHDTYLPHTSDKKKNPTENMMIKIIMNQTLDTCWAGQCFSLGTHADICIQQKSSSASTACGNTYEDNQLLSCILDLPTIVKISFQFYRIFW